MPTAYLGLGANLENPLLRLQQAVGLLRVSDYIQVTALSRFYRTKPVGGPLGQPDYVNAVAKIDCALEPGDLLEQCLLIELEMGRVRTQRWSSRSIDIDLLLFDDRVIDTPELVVPHPMLRKRLFALLPLSDVAPEEIMLPPDGKRLSQVVSDALRSPDFADQFPIKVADSNSYRFEAEQWDGNQ